MNIFKNKYFLFGNLAFLLIVIPVALYFIRNQTHTRGSAAPLTTISFNPPNLSTSQCSDITSDVELDPAQNVVSNVKLVLTWDASKFSVTFAPNNDAFGQIIDGPTITDGKLSVTLSNSDATKFIVTQTKVGTLTIHPLSPTDGTPVTINVDPSTEIHSVSDQDNISENVLKTADKLGVAITADTCNNASPSVTQTPLTPTTTQTPTTPSVTPIPTTPATNALPTCSNFTASPNSGYAPLNVAFSVNGQDTDGTLTQASFNFGDGTAPLVVTSGMGVASTSAQASHTYNAGGTFNATVTFTDNNSGVSSACTQQVAVGGPVTPTTAPTSPPAGSGGSGGGVVATSTPTPTIANPGGITTTIGIIGGVVIAIVGGLFLLIL